MIILTEKQIIDLHTDLIDNTGGTIGIRDGSLLSSAINSPFITFDGKFVYTTIEDMAAKLTVSLTKNHAFLDGNKRIAAHILNIFLFLNGIALNYTQNELVDLFIGIASSSYDSDFVSKWIIEHGEVPSEQNF